ncbi:hypothetical protein B0H14DRAFT_3046259 [Mycena olivaceomarginata]|nr:hypothetical protein B0H14DRAFT_3046259 [Mycena olivaceomarginata]
MSLLYREDAYSYARQTYSAVSASHSPVAATQNLNATTVSTNRHPQWKLLVATPPVAVLKDVSAACEADETDASVAAIVRKIAVCKASGTQVAVLHQISPAIWPRLYENISEQERANYRINRLSFPLWSRARSPSHLSDLDEKVEMYLTRPDVECVVGLHFKTPQFNNPPPSATKEDPSGRNLGPIKYLRHVWAPAITGLVVILWVKGHQPGAATREEWDIFPTDNDADLRKRQEEVVKILRKVTRGVIGKADFKLIFRDKHGFNINWDGFYPDLGRRLMSDAFKQYFAWSTEPEDAVVIQIDHSSARKRTLDLYGADSDDLEEEAVEQPPHKMVKLEESNRVCKH